MLHDQAPHFALFDTEKKKINLSEFRGQNVLLLFFPFAFTSTCTAELCTVRDHLKFYNNANAAVLGISVDSLYTLKKYKEELQLNFSLISDFNKEVSKLYDSYYDEFYYEMKGVSKRSAFVIDKMGIVQYVEILENANEIPDFNKINACLNRLQ
jgi:glutaredoxin-dependent peroxiredoxin